MMKCDIYVFPQTVYSLPNEKTGLNILEKDGNTWFRCFYNENYVDINLDVLRDGSSTCVILPPTSFVPFVLYDFREILEVLGLSPSEFLINLQTRCFLQIDRCGDRCFVKAFTLQGELFLNSDTHDFSDNVYYTKDDIHPLDWKYSFKVKSVSVNVEIGKLFVELDVDISEYYSQDLFLSHSGQSKQVFNGINSIVFDCYNGTEDLYLGSFNCRYVGRKIEIKPLLEKG